MLFLGKPGEPALEPRDLITIGLFVIAGVLITRLNVSRQRALRAAHDQGRWFRTTLGSIGDAVIATDRHGRVQFLNAVGEELTGWSVETARGRPIEEVMNIVDERTRSRRTSPVERVIREGRIIGLANHTLLLSRSGDEHVIEDSAAPIRDEWGELSGVVMVFRDTTRASREKRRRHALGEATAVLAGSLDYGATLASVAELLAPALGDSCVIRLVEKDGESATNVSAPPDSDDPHLEALVSEVIESGRSSWAPRDGADGAEGRSYVVAPLRARERVLGAIALLASPPRRHYDAADVQFVEEVARRSALAVEHARLYRAAQRSNEKAREAIRARDEFLQIASHELKTPLTPLRLQLESLKESLTRAGVRDAQLAAKLDTAARQTSRLNRLVESLLDVTRITAGRVILDPELVDVAELVTDVAERFRDEAGRKGTQITVHAEGSAWGQWDRIRLEQIVSNLLANAIKYGAGKPVEIETRTSEGVVRIAVTDHGIGIDRDALERIFGRFERAVSARNYGGLGLGLFIARQFAEAHGGSVLARSQPGVGSTFTVLLPLEPRVEPPSERDETAA